MPPFMTKTAGAVALGEIDHDLSALIVRRKCALPASAARAECKAELPIQ